MKKIILTILLISVLAGCSTPSGSAVVSGTATYLQKIALPPEAVLIVQISEIWADKDGKLLAESTTPLNGKQVPIAFEVPYPTKNVDENISYFLAARIEDGQGNVLFRTPTTENGVITKGNPVKGLNVLLAQESSMSLVSGAISYREKIALPADATVKVILEDVSKMDVAAEVIAETSFVTAGKQVPFTFELGYDPALIQAKNRYNLRVRFEDAKGRLLFVTDTITPIITMDNPVSGLELMLISVGGS